MRNFILICIMFIIITSLIGETDSTNVAESSLDFTYLVADAVGFGSTALMVTAKDLPIIYIEAFPAIEACSQDPNTITEADLIIQNVHGHETHYNAEVASMVAKNTGAFVLGNATFKADMIKNGVEPEKIIELTPDIKKNASFTIESLGLTITAYRMEHTMMPKVYVDTYLIEMPNGIKWYHGTCSSGPNTLDWMELNPELKDLDIMLLDCDIDFAEAKEKFSPNVLIKTHDFKSEVQPAPIAVYTDYPNGEIILEHEDVWTYTK